MRTWSFPATLLGAGLLVALMPAPPATAAQHAHQHGATPAATTAPPPSVRAEHEAIVGALSDAQKAPGSVGAAAKALADVPHPHFVREEEIALPPLGLLARLASGQVIGEQESAAIVAMSDALKRELPRMLEEHKAIRAAVERLRDAAVAARAEPQRRLAEQLAHHAQTEEEVLYPAAVLVGEVLRQRHAHE